jgi:hypothetical protein
MSRSPGPSQARTPTKQQMTGTNDQGNGTASESGSESTTPEIKPGDAPCSICGTRLGWAMVRRGQTTHKPECPKAVAA